MLFLKEMLYYHCSKKKNIYFLWGGNMEKMTGKPSIDKPWLKYYDEEVLNKNYRKRRFMNILQKIIKNIQIELP